MSSSACCSYSTERMVRSAARSTMGSCSKSQNGGDSGRSKLLFTGNKAEFPNKEGSIVTSILSNTERSTSADIDEKAIEAGEGIADLDDSSCDKFCQSRRLLEDYGARNPSSSNSAAVEDAEDCAPRPEVDHHSDDASYEDIDEIGETDEIENEYDEEDNLHTRNLELNRYNHLFIERVEDLSDDEYEEPKYFGTDIESLDEYDLKVVQNREGKQSKQEQVLIVGGNFLHLGNKNKDQGSVLKKFRLDNRRLQLELLRAEEAMQTQRSVIQNLTFERDAFKRKMQQQVQLLPAISCSTQPVSDAVAVKGLLHGTQIIQRDSETNYGTLERKYPDREHKPGNSDMEDVVSQNCVGLEAGSMETCRKETCNLEVGKPALPDFPPELEDPPVVCKLAQRIRLKKANAEDGHVTGVELRHVGVSNQILAEQLVASFNEEGQSQEIFYALASAGGNLAPHELLKEYEVEVDRLNARVDHLKAQNDVLSISLTESKAHCDHLSTLMSKYEANSTAQQLMVSTLDMTVESLEVLMALLESELGLLVATYKVSQSQQCDEDGNERNVQVDRAKKSRSSQSCSDKFLQTPSDRSKTLHSNINVKTQKPGFKFRNASTGRIEITEGGPVLKHSLRTVTKAINGQRKVNCYGTSKVNKELARNNRTSATSEHLEKNRIEELLDTLRLSKEHRRATENIARHLLSRCEKELNITLPCTDANYESQETCDVNRTEEVRIRELVNKLREDRRSMGSCVVHLESLLLDPLTPSKPLPEPEVLKLDLENAVLMQELTAAREERAELRAQVYLSEREKAGLELQISTLDARLFAQQATIDLLKMQLSRQAPQDNSSDSGVCESHLVSTPECAVNEGSSRSERETRGQQDVVSERMSATQDQSEDSLSNEENKRITSQAAGEVINSISSSDPCNESVNIYDKDKENINCVTANSEKINRAEELECKASDARLCISHKRAGITQSDMASTAPILESELKSRISTLVSTLEKLSEASEARHKQSQQFIDDLRRANSALVAAVERLKKKYSLRLRRLEQQNQTLMQRRTVEVQCLKQTILQLEEQLTYRQCEEPSETRL